MTPTITAAGVFLILEEKMERLEQPKTSRWLNRTVLGIGLASLFSDWSHEIASALLPAFLASMGVAAAWLGLIEGVADGLSSFAKMASGFYTDRLQRRKPIAVVGYLVTALGTASFAFAQAAWQILLARSFAWLGRGVRTPVRKALLAGSVEKNAYGRAFGFERMMDTFGAIIGPASAFLLIKIFRQDYSRLFLVPLIPGILAAMMMAFIVQEKHREPVPHISFGQSLRDLPFTFRWLLVAVGIFGLGDFAHTLLILFASQKLAAAFGQGKAASLAVGFYLLHNIFYAGCSYGSGWLADRVNKKRLLAGGYLLAALMALCMIGLPFNLMTVALIFLLGGIYVAIEETLEDSLCAELVPENQHGMAFGVLATVNGVGDLLSSVMVGWLWTKFGTGVALSYSLLLFIIGAAMVLKINTAQEQSP